MTHRLLERLFVPLFVIALAAPVALLAQAPAPAASAAPPSFAPAEKIPFDAAVTTGTLPNGLKYYIRRNTRPEKRVSLRLAVKAGSVDEENDQQGLAHFHVSGAGHESYSRSVRGCRFTDIRVCR